MAAINIVLILLLARQLAHVTWRVIPDPDLQSVQGTAPTPGAARVFNSASLDLGRRIAALHLFGQDMTAMAQQAPVNAPETRLNLKLLGVVFSPVGNNSLALIASPSQGERNYRLDDNLPGGARIHAIHEDRVILARNNAFETLKLPEKDLTMGGGVARSDVGRAGPGIVTEEDRLRAEELKALRAQLLSRPEKFLELMSIDPAYDDNGFAGFRIGPGKDPALLKRFGLNQGDVVTNLNGVDLSDPLKGMQALSAMAKADALTIKIQRDGNLLDYQFPIAK
ncbi:putative general secretion pathway protein C [Magnetofaba australis IT-1]|uniref:Putative general secretion pathway protein C n=1 Tax=Magnetofaba australis IT-1 TaxID=1434232 RepID=A0A1Y2K9I0_9PROT|nr:putative general secretion pathway protein C [Magnetofaba australis IT-1]